MDQIEKEMLKQMRAKSDENRMKGEEDERKRATEKHKYVFFLRIEQASDQSGRFLKKKRRTSRMKKKKKNGERQKKGRHLENINSGIFFRKSNGVKKKRRCRT